MAPLVDLPPLSVILSWPKPNYVDPVRRGPELFIITAIGLTLATVCVGLRMYARLHVRKWFGMDDAMIIVSLICTIGVTTAVFLGTSDYSWDRHVWDVPIDQVLPGGKLLFVSVICWAMASCFTKVSLLCFYYRLVEHIQFKRFRWILHIVIVAQICFMVAYVLTLIFMCVPIDAFWTYPPNLNATCIHTADFLFTVSIINTLFELIVWILPLPLLMALPLDHKQRIPVTILLCLGLCVPVVGAVRCYYVYIDMVISWDVYWYSVPHWICSDVENDLALICACIPALRPLFGRWMGWENHNDENDSMHPGTSPLTTSRPSAPQTPDSMSQMKYNNPNTLVWFDLEGIGGEDGLGYSVSVTAGKMPGQTTQQMQQQQGNKGTTLLKNMSSRNILRHKMKKRRGSVGNGARDERSGGENEKRSRGTRSRLGGNKSGGKATDGNSSSGERRPSTARASRSRTGIFTKRTVEIHESFGSDEPGLGDGGEEIRVWQSPSLKEGRSSSSTLDELTSMNERLDRLGVLPEPRNSEGGDGGRFMRFNGSRPRTAPAPSGPRVPDVAAAAVGRSVSPLPQWLTPPPQPLGGRRLPMSVLMPRNSSQRWVNRGSGSGADSTADKGENTRDNTTALRPHTSAAATGSRATPEATTTTRREDPLPSESDDASFMQDMEHLRSMLGPRRALGDDESVFVEDGSNTSGRGISGKKNTTREREAMLRSQKAVKEWTDSGTQTRLD